MKINSVKYSINRKEKFQIKTIIYEKDDGQLQVRKEPYSSKSVSHVVNIVNNYEILKKSNINYVPTKLVENCAVFPYIEGELYENKLMDLLLNGLTFDFIKEIENFRNLLLEESLVEFHETVGFNEIFGVGTELKGKPSLKVSNIDMTFDNMIYTNKQLTVIDYEWVFDFPVPIDYILFRSIRVFLSKYPNSIDEDLLEQLYLRLNIDNQTRSVFEKMERKFVEYTGFQGNQYLNYLKRIDKIENLINIQNQMLNDKPFLQVFFDKGQGFNEEMSIKVSIEKEEEFCQFAINLPSEKMQGLRIDPISTISKVRLNMKLFVDEKEYDLTDKIIGLHDTMIIKKDNEYINLFNLSQDPQIFIDDSILNNDCKKTLVVCMNYSKMISAELLNLYKSYEMKNNEIDKYRLTIDEFRLELDKLVKENFQLIENNNEVILEKEKVEKENMELLKFKEKVLSSFLGKVLFKKI